MNIVNEAYSWRDIVSSVPEECEVYNPNSLAGYIDNALEYYRGISDGENLNDCEVAGRILIDVKDLFDEYRTRFGGVDEMYISGNGMYLPEESTELCFFDGSRGLAGEYGGFSIESLPLYQDLLYRADGKYRVQPTLCLILKDYHGFTRDTGIALETTGESVLVPIEHQDLCYLRSYDSLQ